MARDGNNHLFVSNVMAGLGEYDVTTGATIIGPFANQNSQAVVQDGHNHLLLDTSGNFPVSQFDSTTGALLINHFIDGTGLPGGLALDGSNHVFVSYRL